MSIKIIASIFCWIAYFSSYSQALEFEGFQFPGEIKIENEKLVLNGLAVRKATIFNIRVLAAALYLTDKSSDSESILRSPNPKQIQIRFLKNLAAETISKIWTKQLMQNCLSDCKLLQEKSDRLGNYLSDFKTRDLLVISFFKNHVVVLQNNGRNAIIESGEFSKAFFSIWIGQNPLNKDLKNDLLSNP